MDSGLSNLQIEKVMQRYKNLSKFFKGCYALDELSSLNFRSRSAFIVNTHIRGKTGHWLAIVIPDNNTVEYFDSFGRNPSGPLNNFVNRFDKKIINKKCFQHALSSTCGEFCVFYITEHFKGSSPTEIFSTLDKVKDCDKFVQAYFHNLTGNSI